MSGIGSRNVLRILLVDDEAMIRRFLRHALEQSGYRVDEAESGETGLDALHAVSYDLVITDIVMPGMSGVELVETSRRTWPQIPVIVMSGGGRLGDDDHLQTALDLGAAAAVNKPFRLRELQNVIESVLSAAVEDEDARTCTVAC